MGLTLDRATSFYQRGSRGSGCWPLRVPNVARHGGKGSEARVARDPSLFPNSILQEGDVVVWRGSRARSSLFKPVDWARETRI